MPSDPTCAVDCGDRDNTGRCTRRKHMGIQFSRGGAQAGRQRRQRPTKPTRPRKPWTEEQRSALLFHATAMCNDSGHTFRECMVEIARLQSEHRKQR